MYMIPYHCCNKWPQTTQFYALTFPEVWSLKSKHQQSCIPISVFKGESVSFYSQLLESTCIPELRTHHTAPPSCFHGNISCFIIWFSCLTLTKSFVITLGWGQSLNLKILNLNRKFPFTVQGRLFTGSKE